MASLVLPYPDFQPNTIIRSAEHDANNAAIVNWAASVATLDAANVFTVSGTAIKIKPTTDPAANTKLFEVQNAAGTSLFSVDLEGDAALAGLLTLSRSGQQLLLKPAVDPAANTKLLELQNAAGTSLFSVDLEGDVVAATLSEGGVLLANKYAPLVHKTRHAASGADPLTPADIGAVNKAGDTMTGDLRWAGAFGVEAGGYSYWKRLPAAIGSLAVYGAAWTYNAVYDAADARWETIADGRADALGIQEGRLHYYTSNISHAGAGEPITWIERLAVDVDGVVQTSDTIISKLGRVLGVPAHFHVSGTQTANPNIKVWFVTAAATNSSTGYVDLTMPFSATEVAYVNVMAMPYSNSPYLAGIPKGYALSANSIRLGYTDANGSWLLVNQYISAVVFAKV